MMAVLDSSGSNPATAAARSKARRAKLLDETRMRQLLQMTPDQLVTGVADCGYRTEIDTYSMRLEGAELVEVALKHNLSRELSEVVRYCQGVLKNHVKVYTDRFSYQNAKIVLRAVAANVDSLAHNDVSTEEVSKSILPEENDFNSDWLALVNESSSLKEAVDSMSGTPWGRALSETSAESTLQEMEDALDRHYYSEALSATRMPDPSSSTLRRYIQTEVDHLNITNILRGLREGLPVESRANMLLSGGRIWNATQLRNAAAVDDHAGLVDLLRRSSNFDAVGFEEALSATEGAGTLDSALNWLSHQIDSHLRRMSYLHPLSALPVINYIASKAKEVSELLLIVRGLSAGLDRKVIEEHLSFLK